MPPAPIHVREVPKPAHDRACTLFERRGGERKNINTRGLLERRTERSAKGQPRLGPDKRQEERRGGERKRGGLFAHRATSRALIRVRMDCT